MSPLSACKVAIGLLFLFAGRKRKLASNSIAASNHIIFLFKQGFTPLFGVFFFHSLVGLGVSLGSPSPVSSPSLSTFSYQLSLRKNRG